MTLEDGTSSPSEEYTTAEFRRSMATAFEAARYQDKIVRVNHHGKPWVSIISPEHADSLSRLNAFGRLEKRELGEILDTIEGDVGIEELVDKVAAMRLAKL